MIKMEIKLSLVFFISCIVGYLLHKIGQEALISKCETASMWQFSIVFVSSLFVIIIFFILQKVCSIPFNVSTLVPAVTTVASIAFPCYHYKLVNFLKVTGNYFFEAFCIWPNLFQTVYCFKILNKISP
ncbi:hypothetical protein M9Y10_007024 [Tritrichomonas musculus]|uniref:EamA domain-containing protein n=1 Tax=Tritrichomonas musculus TaxID=1915356 RepID=A0ABR2J1A2_9EUKA